MKTADLRGSSRVIPYHKNCLSELAVIILPLTLWGNVLNGIPMLDYFAVRESKQIVEGTVLPAKIALANTKHEIAFGKDAMQAVVIDAAAIFICFCQSRTQCGCIVHEAWIVFGKVVRINKLAESGEALANQHCFYKRSNEGAVGFGLIKINSLGGTVDHTVARRVGPFAFLDIVPMLHRLAVFESKDLETDSAAGKIVFGMAEDEVSVFERAHDIDVR